MDWARRLFTFKFGEHPRLVALVQGGLYAIAAGMLGWLLGRTLVSPTHNLVASLVFMGVCALVTLKRPLWGLLFTSFLHPFANFLYLNVDLGAGIPDIFLLRVTVAITFALVLARGATHRRLFSPLTWIDVFMGLTTIGLGISVLRGTSLTADLQWLFDMYITPYIIYYIAKNMTTDRSRLQRVLWILALIGTYSAVYGIYTVTTGNVLFVGSDGIGGSTWYSENLRAMRGLLGDPYVFGLVFSLAIPIDFYLLIKARSTKKRLLCALMLIVTAGGLFFTYKRTAWIATMGSLAIIQFFFPRFRKLFLVLLVLGIGVMVIFADQINESAVVTERASYQTESLNGRIDLWDAAIQAWKKEPTFGYGFGGYYARTSLEAIESHYLWILVDAGLVGFVPYILLFALLMWTSVRLYRARTAAVFVDSDLVAIFWGSFTAYLISLSTVVMNHEFPHILFFMLAGAMIGSQDALIDRRLDEQSKTIA